MSLPLLPPAAYDRVLHYLLSTRDMDPDDAMDWIDDHYDVQDTNDSIVRNR